MNYSLRQILTVLARKGYLFYDKPYQANIIAIRSHNTTPNAFDDFFHLIYRDQKRSRHYEFTVTTDPGTYWLKNPCNVDGTAILVPGQYRDAYKIRKHKGQYDAVCQEKSVKVWRDANKDDVLDFGGKEYEGVFGINIHRSDPETESYSVDKWSAGCTVFKRVKDFNLFMRVCKKSAELHGNVFSYTLLTECDF